MNIQLKSWEVKNLHLEAVNDSRIRKQTFRFSCGNGISESDEKEFFIGFRVVLNDPKFNLQLEIHFSFEADEALTEEFKSSSFLKINAPAIAFPYLRSYISNLTMQSGYDTVVLPSVNFVRIARDAREPGQ